MSPVPEPSSPATTQAAQPVVSSSRDKILDTAEALFARRGFDGVGLREVARRSELSKSALFHHFPTKLDLYGAVVERILSDILEAIAPLRDQGTTVERLSALIRCIVDVLADSPTRAPLLLRSLFEGEVLDGHHGSDEADALLARILGRASEIMQRGVDSGELRAVPVSHALQSLIGMLVFHFASGPFGDEVLGAPVYSSAEINRFKEFVVSFTVNGLVAHTD